MMASSTSSLNRMLVSQNKDRSKARSGANTSLTSPQCPTARLREALENTAVGDKASLVVGRCEEELQDLMLQIDKMVQDKKCEWERDLELVQTRLHSKEQECAALHEQVKISARECAALRSNLDEAQALRRKANGQAEAQVNALRLEVQSMGRAHERLIRKHEKRQRQWEHELSESRASADAARAEVGRKQSALDEAEHRWRDLEQTHGVDLLRDQASAARRSALEEKCALAQQQVMALQSQLERCRALQDGTESSLKAQVASLERELARTRSAQQAQAENAESLRISLTQSTEALRRAQQDKELLEGELRTTRRNVLRLEDEAARVAAQLCAKEHELKRSEADLQHRLSDLAAAQRHIGTTPLDGAECDGCSPAAAARLEAQLMEARIVAKMAQRNEKRALSQCALLNAKLEQLENLGRKVNREGEHHEQHQQEKMAVHEMHNQTTELCVVQAQLDALRLENRQLRQQVHSPALNLTARLQDTERALKDAISRADSMENAATEAAAKFVVLSKETDRLCAENLALVEFVAGVTGTLAGSSNESSSPSTQQLSLQISQHLLDNSNECDANFSIMASQFLEEEKQRSRNLETLLNGHIENVRLQSLQISLGNSEAENL